MRTAFLNVGLLVGLSASLIACGGVSKEDANKAFQAMSTALTQASAGAQAGRPFNGALRTAASPLTSTIDYNFVCPEGGSLNLKGSLDSGETTSSFNYTAAFAKCSAQSIDIDGSITFALALSGNYPAFTMSYTYKGKLDFSGDVEGSCDFDLQGSCTTASCTYSGTICGYSASETITSGG